MPTNKFVKGDELYVGFPQRPNSMTRQLGQILLCGTLTFMVPENQTVFSWIDSKENSYEQTVNNLVDKIAQLRKETSELQVVGNLRRDIALRQRSEEIVSFRMLNNNWDGYGAIPSDAKSVTNVLSIINKLSDISLLSLDDIYPDTNGTISLKWRNSFNERISVNVGLSEMSYYVYKLDSAPSFFQNVEINEMAISSLDDEVKSIVVAHA